MTEIKYKITRNCAFIPYDNLFTDDIDVISKMISLDDFVYHKSNLYNTETKKEELNENVRESESVTLRDKDLLSYINNNLISKMNKLYNTDFTMIVPSVDIVKYKKGSKFGKHVDFCVFNSNTYVMFALLICLKGGCEGGNTILYNGEEKIYCPQSKTVGSGIVFQNTIPHEGEEILEGEKIILKVDLLLTNSCIKNYITNIDKLKRTILSVNSDNKIIICETYKAKQYVINNHKPCGKFKTVPFQAFFFLTESDDKHLLWFSIFNHVFVTNDVNSPFWKNFTEDADNYYDKWIKDVGCTCSVCYGCKCGKRPPNFSIYKNYEYNVTSKHIFHNENVPAICVKISRRVGIEIRDHEGSTGEVYGTSLEKFEKKHGKQESKSEKMNYYSTCAVNMIGDILKRCKKSTAFIEQTEESEGYHCNDSDIHYSKYHILGHTGYLKIPLYTDDNDDVIFDDEIDIITSNLQYEDEECEEEDEEESDDE